VIRIGLTRVVVRAIVLSVSVVVTVVTVAGCGAAHAVLGIHEPPKVNAASASLTVDQASNILTRAFTAAQQAETKTGAPAQAARKTAYTGEGLRRANARVKLAKVHPAVAGSPVLAPPQPGLLAVSRGFGYPRVIVAQTEASQASEGSPPILHLLTSPDVRTPYRISESATMLPDSKVKPFDSLSQGSPLVIGRSDLAVAPAALLNAYAARLAFPAKAATNPPFTADPLAAQVRAGAAGVARAVADQARFSQVHKVVPNTVYAVRQAGGDALVFGVIERTDSFEVKPDQAVNTADNLEFVLLSGKERITKAASITTLELVVFAVPRSRGKARLVAASEQLVAGSGS
jgi:hypothetical protein